MFAPKTGNLIENQSLEKKMEHLRKGQNIIGEENLQIYDEVAQLDKGGKAGARRLRAEDLGSRFSLSSVKHKL